MSLFAFSDGTIEELHSAVARFWWGSTDTHRKIHWMRWDKLCEPKEMGGMGFRDLRVFNQTLLAKQVWRLLINPSSLAARVLKARYFRHDSVLDARLGYDPSYTWRSLWGAKALLREGLKWRVGDGHQINVWQDAWLPGENASRVPTPIGDVNLNMKVEELIDHAEMRWREDVVRGIMRDEDVEEVLSLTLSKRRPCDMLYWWPNNKGYYSVKSGYKLGKGVYNAHGDQLWRKLWTLKIPPKLAHFTWRASMDVLPVRENLF
ncbi:putative mitochondrial protein AtMg00310 [Silene latifolia]|uniref:putative mitochondrial protein AtMg00310 n=1 Tax=Silene latifolia TaxID=37657 RepID=UPI003D76CCB3